MLDKNISTEAGKYVHGKICSEEVDSKMQKFTGNNNMNMAQFYAFSKIVNDDQITEEDGSGCSTAASNNIPSELMEN